MPGFQAPIADVIDAAWRADFALLAPWRREADIPTHYLDSG